MIKETLGIDKRINYLIELISLRNCLGQSRKDTAWAEDELNPSRRLVYLIDSNLTFLYFQPALEPNTTRPLKSIPTQQNDSWTAIITSHFLFNGDLPGKASNALYIDPGHMLEFSNKLSSVTEKLISLSIKLNEHDKVNFAFAVKSIRDEITNSPNDAGALKDIFDTRILKLFNDFKIDNVGSLRLLHDLVYRKDLIRPLHLGPHLSDCDIKNLDSVSVNEWIGSLSALSKNAVNRSENIRRDAECLTRIEKINSHLAEYGVDVRYVLITADKNMIEAVRRKYGVCATPESGPIVRNLLQYVPIGNIRDVDNYISRSDGTHAIETAIDTLFAVEDIEYNNRDKRLDKLNTIARNFFDESQKLNDIENYDEKNCQKVRLEKMMSSWFHDEIRNSLNETKENVESGWQSLIDNSVKLNQGVILSHYRRWLHDLIDALNIIPMSTKEDIGRAYENNHLKIASELTRSHLNLVLSSAIIMESDKLEEWSKIGVGIRLHNGNATQLSETLAGKIIFHLSNNSRKTSLALLDKLCSVEIDFKQVIIAGAAIALQTGLWHISAELARLSYLYNDAIKDDSSWLNINRAKLIEIISIRSSFLDGENQDIEFTTLFINDVVNDIENIISEFLTHDYLMECSLAYSELCWWNSLDIIMNSETVDVSVMLDRVFTATGHAFDFAVERSDREIQDFTGAQIADVSRARAGSALVFAIIKSNSEGHSIPTAARSLLKPVYDHLHLMSKISTKESKNTIWKLLSIFAREVTNGHDITSIRNNTDFINEITRLEKCGTLYKSKYKIIYDMII